MMTTIKITSSTNPKIKQVVRLRDRKARDETGLSMVEGVREVTRAREAGVAFQEIYFCPELLEKYSPSDLVQKIAGKDSKTFEVSAEVFEKISFGERREGVVALFQPVYKNFKDLKIGRESVMMVLEEIEKPGNLGAILRTCDGAGIHALFIADEKTDLYNPNIIRASMGTVFFVPVIRARAQDILQFLKSNKVCLIASSPNAGTVYSDQKFSFPLALALGSEQKGLSEFWINHADAVIKIPMKGKADSLNVSNTAAILAYECLRQLRRSTQIA